MFFGCSSAISVSVAKLSSLSCVTSFIKVCLIFMAVWGIHCKFHKNDNSHTQTCLEFKEAVSFLSITAAANNNLFTTAQLCSCQSVHCFLSLIMKVNRVKKPHDKFQPQSVCAPAMLQLPPLFFWTVQVNYLEHHPSTLNTRWSKELTRVEHFIPVFADRQTARGTRPCHVSFFTTGLVHRC